MKVTQLQGRLQGAIRPGIVLTLTDDAGTIDTTIYTWTMTGAPATTGKTAWTKTTGLTATTGGQLAITWQAGDLGICTVPTGKQAAVWEFELNGASASGPRKCKLTMEIDAIQTP